MSQNGDLSYLLEATEHFIQKFRYPVDLAFWSELHVIVNIVYSYAVFEIVFLAYTLRFLRKQNTWRTVYYF